MIRPDMCVAATTYGNIIVNNNIIIDGNALLLVNYVMHLLVCTCICIFCRYIYIYSSYRAVIGLGRVIG